MQTGICSKCGLAITNGQLCAGGEKLPKSGSPQNLIQNLREENAKLRVALADAIRRPLGVAPDSAIEFLTETNHDV